MKPIKIGMLGLGTVGCGVLSVLQENAQEIQRRCGCAVEVVQASARQLGKKRPVSTTGIELVEDPFAVVRNDEIDVVLELIGGTDIARDLAMATLASGKHLITANKALIALHGNEIFAEASKNNVMVAFEAAVAGGIPIIKVIREGLCANQVEWIAGIINGTCNFILTEMAQKQTTFKDALASAQLHGYAEADPSFDVGGIDAAHKLTILTSLALGCPLKFDQVYIEGITEVQSEDILYAAELGYYIKHLGIMQQTDQGVVLRVSPMLVPQSCLLAQVDHAMNAVMVSGNAVGPTFYYGAGAGAKETASAVVADLIDVIRMRQVPSKHWVPYLGCMPDQVKDIRVIPVEETVGTYYLRFIANDKPGVMSRITGILAKENISIEAVLQKEPHQDESQLPIVLLTHHVNERDLRCAIDEIRAFEGVSKEIICLRIYNFKEQA